MDNCRAVSTYMKSPVTDHSPAASPFRHSGAKWRAGLSLRARLAVLVGLGVAAVIALLSLLEVRLVERTVETQLVDSARSTALAVANGMGSLDEADVPGWLHDFITADPAVRAITTTASLQFSRAHRRRNAQRRSISLQKPAERASCGSSRPMRS
jgi:hypothetical protein